MTEPAALAQRQDAPGLGELFDPLGLHRDDPYPFYADARSTEPVFFSPRLDAWCVTRYDDVTAILADPNSFSSREVLPKPKGLPPAVDAFLDWFWGPAGALTFTDPPEHTRIRAVASKGLTARFVQNFEPTVQEVMARHLDRVAAMAEFDFLSEVAYSTPVYAILDIVGIPRADHERFRRWNELVFAIVIASHQLDEATINEYGREMYAWRDYVRALVAERRVRPQQDIMSFLVHGEVRGHRLSDDEAAIQVMAMLAAGHESTAHAMANTVRLLLSRPSRWRQLLDGSVAVEDIVEECLRLESPITQLYRIAHRDTAINGRPIAAGDKVCMLWSSVCHDDAYYERPGEYLPGRPNKVRDIAFGQGIHYCVGAPLVRMELRIMLEQLRERLPGLRLLSGGVPRYRSVHHFRALEHLLLGS